MTWFDNSLARPQDIPISFYLIMGSIGTLSHMAQICSCFSCRRIQGRSGACSQGLPLCNLPIYKGYSHSPISMALHVSSSGIGFRPVHHGSAEFHYALASALKNIVQRWFTDKEAAVPARMPLELHEKELLQVQSSIRDIMMY